MAVCYIVGAVPVAVNFEKREGDLVIAADGGLDSLKRAGILPDVFIGDMDSVSDPQIPENVETIILPVEKDDTDSAMAVRFAAGRGYTKFVVYGCIGGAIDHTLANCALLKNMAEQGFTAVFENGENGLTAFENSNLVFSDKAKGRISILSMSDISCGVNISGMKYAVSGAKLTSSVPLGVSNEFIGKYAAAVVEQGVLCVYTAMENLMEHSDLFDKSKSQ